MWTRWNPFTRKKRPAPPAKAAERVPARAANQQDGAPDPSMVILWISDTSTPSSSDSCGDSGSGDSGSCGDGGGGGESNGRGYGTAS